MTTPPTIASSQPDTTRAPRAPGAGLGLRQDRPRGPRAGPPRGRRRAGLHRVDGRAHRRRRGAGDAGRGADRLPRVPRRPRQDAAPAGARRHPGRPPPRVPRAQLAELGIEPFDLVVSNLYPFTDTVASGAAPDECVEQIDIGGPSMVRAAAKNHPSVAIVTSPGQYADLRRLGAGRRHHPRPAPPARRRGVRAHRVVRRRGGLLDGQRADRHQRRHRLPGLGRRDVGEEGGAALRREPAPAGRALRRLARGRAGRRRAAARQGDVLQQLRRRRRGPTRGGRLRRPGGGDHQARQPLRHRGRRRRRRGPPQGPRLRPGQRLRRRDRGQRAGQRRDGRAGGRGVHRGRRGAGLRGRCRGGAGPQEERAAARRTGGRGARRRRDAPGQRRPAAAGARPRRRLGRGRRGRPGRPGRWRPGRRPPTRCSPTSRSRGRPAAR